jgi:protein-tyrosine phosphatase
VVADEAECLGLAQAFVADGVRVAVGTPHVRDDYPTTPDAMEAALERARGVVREAGLPLEVLGGGEIALDRLSLLDDDALSRFSFGEARVVLLESPVYGWPLDLQDMIWGLRVRGYTPVLAHPERNAEVAENPSRLRPYVEAGALAQLTAASVDGRFGRPAAKVCRELLDLELAHFISSDAHGAGVREAGLSAAVEAVGPELGSWLTQDVPAALLAGEPLPPRPPGRRRRLFRR